MGSEDYYVTIFFLKSNLVPGTCVGEGFSLCSEQLGADYAQKCICIRCPRALFSSALSWHPGTMVIFAWLFGVSGRLFLAEAGVWAPRKLRGDTTSAHL